MPYAGHNRSRAAVTHAGTVETSTQSGPTTGLFGDANEKNIHAVPSNLAGDGTGTGR
jgi:hypothetical protein